MCILAIPLRSAYTRNDPINAEDPMSWRQFLTPVTSIDTDQARSYLADKKVDEVTILDVRQPLE